MRPHFHKAILASLVGAVALGGATIAGAQDGERNASSSSGGGQCIRANVRTEINECPSGEAPRRSGGWRHFAQRRGCASVDSKVLYLVVEGCDLLLLVIDFLHQGDHGVIGFQEFCLCL